MTHVQVFVIQAAFYHDPADQALQTAQEKQDYKRLHHVFFKPALLQENNEWHKEHYAQQTSPNPVKPFPEENEFKIGKGEMRIEMLKLRDLLVLAKSGLPVGFAKRRNKTQQRFP